MAYKLYIDNNYFVLENTNDNSIEISEPKGSIRAYIENNILNIRSLSDVELSYFYKFSDLVDSTETAFASVVALQTFLRENTGFKNATIDPTIVAEKLDKGGYQGTAQDLKNSIDGAVSGYQGPIYIADTKTVDGKYDPMEAGTYPNAGGLVYAPETTDKGLHIQFFLVDGVWSKKIIGASQPKTVESVDDLRKIANVKTIEVLGYYAKGDGGGGQFYWDATSTEEDNGGTILQATGVVSGRWKRIFSDVVNTAWFGIEGIIDVNRLMSAIDVCTTNNSQLMFKNGDYITESVIVDSQSINIDFNYSNFTLSATLAAISVKTDLFTFNNCQRVKIKNLNATGLMFTGIDKDNLPETSTTIRTNFTGNNTTIRVKNCLNIDIDNINSNDFTNTLLIDDSTRITLNNINSKDVVTSFEFTNCSDLKACNLKSENAKYDFTENTYGTNPTVRFIGASGSGYIFNQVVNATINDCIADQSATNSFRINGDCENVVFNNCKTYDARRHAFSTYNSENKRIVLNDCTAYRTSNPIVWYGKDQTDTFFRNMFGVSYQMGGESQVTLNNCNAISEDYYNSTPPTIDETQYFNGKYEDCNLIISDTAKVNVFNCYFRGYVYNYNVLISSNDCLLHNNTINGNKIKVGVDSVKSTYSINITGSRNKITNNNLFYGYTCVSLVGTSNECKGNTSFNSYETAFRVMGIENILTDNIAIYNDGSADYVTISGRIVIYGTNAVVKRNSIYSSISISKFPFWYRIIEGADGVVFKDNTAPLNNGYLRVDNLDLSKNSIPNVNPYYLEKTKSTQLHQIKYDVEFLECDRVEGEVVLPESIGIEKNKVFYIQNKNETPLLITGVVGGETNPKLYKNGFAAIHWDGSVYSFINKSIGELHNGSSIKRPSNPLISFQYFDTTLGKPIWYNGTDWIDSDGAVV